MSLSLARFIPRGATAVRSSGLAGRISSTISRATSTASRSGGIASRLSSGLSRATSYGGSLLKTSGGALAGGGAAGYSFANLEQWTGQQDESRRLLILGAVALLAIYSIGQLFDIQIDP